MYEQNESLERCVLVDVDGTIAIRYDRNPFDWAKVGQDLPNEPVIKLVNKLRTTHQIVFMSGRDSCCRAETYDWIRKYYDPLWDPELYGGLSWRLYMRPEGDMRKDSIVKKELYEQHIKNKYYVEYVIDDRLQVCRMWYQMGFTLLRVGDPDADF